MAALTSVRRSAVDGVLEHPIGAAVGAADQAHLFQIVLGLEHIALLGLPHAVIRPSHGVVGIGGERPFVPDLGVVVAAELAAGVAEQCRDIGVVVAVERAECRDARFVVALVVDQRVGGLVADDKVLQRAALAVRRLLLDVRISWVAPERPLARVEPPPPPPEGTAAPAALAISGATRRAETNSTAASE